MHFQKPECAEKYKILISYKLKLLLQFIKLMIKKYNFLTFSRSGGDICFDVTWSLRRNDQNKYPLHIFYYLRKYKISISYKSKVLLHFHIKKYKIKDSNFIISLPLVRVGWIFVLM